MKKRLSFHSFSSSFVVLAAVILLPASAVYATETSTTPAPTTTDSMTPTTTETAQRLATVISKGDQEITRRQTALTALGTKIADTAHLSASNKAALSSQINIEIAALGALKAKLSSETTLDAAHADAKTIVGDYRIYALIMPKIGLIRATDSEQATTARLLALAAKLQTHVSAAGTATDLRTTLDDMIAQATTAQTTANAVQAKILNLQPTDYNSDHTILSGYRDQLKTAHMAIQASIADAKTIIAALKSAQQK